MKRTVRLVLWIGSWLIASAAVGQCRWEPATGSILLSSAAWTGTRFVGLGWDAEGGLVAASGTGVDWTVTARYPGPIGAVLGWNGYELMGIIAPKVWTSPDAATWIEVATDLGALQPMFLTWAADRFFTYLPPLWWGAGRFASTVDGAHWSYLGSERVHAVVYAGSQYVAVGGESQPSIYTSPDAISWTTQTLPEAAMPYGYLSDVAWNGRLLVAVGANGLIATSPDGVNWAVEESGVSGELISVVVTPEGFLCGGEDGAVLTSEDGVTWQPEAAPLAHWLVRLVAGGPTTLAIDGVYGHVAVRSCEEEHRPRRHLPHMPW